MRERAFSRAEVDSILAIVADRGPNLRGHLPGPIDRGIGLRIAATGAANASAYLRRIEEDQAEVERLVEAMVVPVSGLFRDPEVFEVIDALAADERTRELPIVVLTAATMTEEERARLSTQARVIAEKGGATREELLTAVRRVIERSRPVPPGATVVVVDDNESNRELARALLERRGCRVVLADSGDAALARIRAEPPALVLCDLAMPGKDGLEFARELKADPATAGIPLVALTALAMRGDEQRAHEAGFDGYLSKPIDLDALEETLRRFVSPAPGPAGGA